MKKLCSLLLCLTLVLSMAACGSQTPAAPPETKAPTAAPTTAPTEATEAPAEADEGLGIVTTQYGKLQGIPGEDYENVTVFKGVPYAAAPVGDLRWAPPQDPESWDGVRVCDTFGKAAMQPYYVEFVCDYTNEDFEWRHFYPDGAPEQSEDCLYLDVFTGSESSEEKRPVLVWFHGGGYEHGYGFETEFNGEVLADKGVIVVNVTHRLNVMGLLSLPQLSAETTYGGSGNYMLMDCAKAVEWVYENIEAFGGDPSRITIGGQSGGSLKTTATLVSPLTQGMIKNTYNMSSLLPYAFREYATLEDNEAAGLKFLEYFNMDENTPIEEIRALSAEEVMEGFNYAYDNDGFGCGLCIDGYSLTQSAREYYLQPGNLNNLGMMCGNVYGESSPYTAETATELLDQLKARYGEELVNKYDIATTMGIDDNNVAQFNVSLPARADMDIERLFVYLVGQQNENFGFYNFSFDRVTPGSETGWHSSELWYFFASLRDNGLQRDWEEADYQTADNASSYWANFISTGNPNGSDLPNWPASTPGDGFAFQYVDQAPSTDAELNSFDLMVMEYNAQRYGFEFDGLAYAEPVK